MTERKPSRATNQEPLPDQLGVYRETVVDTPRASAAEASVREIYQERTSGPGGDQSVRSEHISVPSDAARRDANAARAKQVIYFIFGAINVLLLIRFVLLLLAANAASPFVNLIDGLSRAFILPFRGIFPAPQLGASVIEWAALVGIAVYSLVAYGLGRLVELIYAPAHPTITRSS